MSPFLNLRISPTYSEAPHRISEPSPYGQWFQENASKSQAVAAENTEPLRCSRNTARRFTRDPDEFAGAKNQLRADRSELHAGGDSSEAHQSGAPGGRCPRCV